MKTTCPYCGNNPVPHRFYRYSESLNIFLTPLRQKFLYNPVSRFFGSKLKLSKMESFFLVLGEKLGIVRRLNDLDLCKVRRAQVLWEEAEKRNIEMAEILLFGKPIDVYVAEKTEMGKLGNGEIGAKSKIIFSGLPRPEGYSNAWLDLMDDKWLFKKAMIKNGLPVPMGASCWTFGQAEKIFTSIQDLSENRPPAGGGKSDLRPPASDLPIPVIVKPRAGSRGRHSTTFVFSAAELKKAFRIAKQLCYWVIVEEQLFGPVYRATIIDGHLAGVLRGDPPQVTGDGQHNIAELINIKNSRPHPGVKEILADKSCELFLSRQNLSLSSILENGRLVNLSEKIGVNYGGSSSEDYDICHPDNKELFLRAAKVLGDPIVGFDFIIPDITVSWKNQKCGFIEVNSLPFINLHHDPLLGAPRNAAALVWDMIKM